MLQTVAQCTETAGAAHRGSMEMTSPDKCTSDSSPPPPPPHPSHPPGPWHVLSLVQETWPDRTRGPVPELRAWSPAVPLRYVKWEGGEVREGWGRGGRGAVLLISAVFDGRALCLGLISVKRMQALSVLYMTAVRWEISRTQRAIKPVESRVGTRLFHVSAQGCESGKVYSSLGHKTVISLITRHKTHSIIFSPRYYTGLETYDSLEVTV